MISLCGFLQVPQYFKDILFLEPTPMYYIIACHLPMDIDMDIDKALLSYSPDELKNGYLRLWNNGKRFDQSPEEPIHIEIEEELSGYLVEFYDGVIPVMSKRLAHALTNAGISNLDFYRSEIYDLATGKVYTDYLAYNLIGTVSAADLSKSEYQAPDGPLISVDFDSVVIDEKKTRGALMFRLAESVNGIVIHESVKKAIEAAGIDTLTFIPPEEWVG